MRLSRIWMECQASWVEWTGLAGRGHGLRHTIGFSFAGTCFSAIFFKRTDKSGRNLVTSGFSKRPNFYNLRLKQKKNQNCRVLPMARNVKHGAGSAETKQFARQGNGCQPWLRLWSVIHSSAPPTLPNRNVSLCGWVPYTRGQGVSYCALSPF